jgi:hypothetical protein
MAMGLEDWEIREQMGLTVRRFNWLLEHHHSTAASETNARYLVRYQARKTLQRQEAVKALGDAKGVKETIPEQNPETGQYVYRWRVAPKPQVALQAIRLLSELDAQEVDVAIRLGMLHEVPKSVHVTEVERPIDEMSHSEILAAYRNEVAEVARLYGRRPEELETYLAEGWPAMALTEGKAAIGSEVEIEVRQPAAEEEGEEATA